MADDRIHVLIHKQGLKRAVSGAHVLLYLMKAARANPLTFFKIKDHAASGIFTQRAFFVGESETTAYETLILHDYHDKPYGSLPFYDP